MRISTTAAPIEMATMMTTKIMPPMVPVLRSSSSDCRYRRILFVVGMAVPMEDPVREEGRMAKYLLLYSGGHMPETEAEQAQVMKAWEGWFTELGPAVADPGNPFTPAVKKITSSGAVSDVAATASGYSILEADSLDLATKLAGGCPVVQGGADITVFETFEAM